MRPEAAIRETGDFGRRTERRRVGEVIAVIAPVGRVQVDEDVWIPRIEHGDGTAALGRLQRHVVAIQVDPLGIGTGTDHFRTVLSTTIPRLGRKLLIAVGVVDGLCDKNDRIQHVGPRIEQEIAQERQQCFFPLDFTGVDVSLHVDDGPP